jgi:hypothetical protein
MKSNKSFNGRYCEGKGYPEYLELIEKSFAMLHPQEKLPFFQMLYNKTHKTFKEGFMWGNGWWIQNSFGFSKNAAAILSPYWLEVLQNSYDLFWDRIGDGKRIGADDGITEGKPFYYSLQAPDGALGDTAIPEDGIIYKQGDGKVEIHDWFYEATAAQLLIQSDIILREHDKEKALKYLPLMERSCNFIEGARDKKNNLFLVGPACNLLAPSYGGSFSKETGKIEKGYLTGLSVTYAAALNKLKEVYLLVDDLQKYEEYKQLEEITKASLKLLLTEENYLVKSMEIDNTKHGVYGAEKYGYLDGVTNIDALAWGVVSKDIETAIYNKINTVNIRPYDFIMNNYPTLDDTYHDYLGEGLHGFFEQGQWVNGGCWGTVEGRAVLAYSKLHKFKDLYNSVSRSMKWAEDFRMDAPFSQSGENSYNPWSDRKDMSEVSVMIDNFAIPTGMIRGIFKFEYYHDSVEITVNLPEEIDEYVQKAPLYFGNKRIYFSVLGNGKINKIYINGKAWNGNTDKSFKLKYDELYEYSNIFVEIIRNKNFEYSEAEYLKFKDKCCPPVDDITDEMLSYLTPEMKDYYEKNLKDYKNIKFDSLQKDILDMLISYSKMKKNPSAAEYFRPLTINKAKQLVDIYEKTVLVNI